MPSSANHFLFGVFRRLLDVAALGLAAQCASYLRFDTALWEQAPIYTLLPYTGCLLLFVGFQDDYFTSPFRGRSLQNIVARMTLTWGAILVGGVVISFFLREAGNPSRLWIIYWFFLGLLSLGAVRTTIYFTLCCLRKCNRLRQKRILIVGYGRTGQEMHRRATAQEYFGYDVRAVCPDSDETVSAKTLPIAVIRRMEDIPAYILTHGIDEVWFALAFDKTEKMKKLQYLLRKTLIDLRFVPDAYSLQIFSTKATEFLGFSAIDLNCPRRYGIEPLVKELLDKVLAFVALVLLAPLMTIVAILIRCSSPGPVLYKQARHGLNGKTFMIYKFRSMKLHEEAAESIVTQATKHDCRITRIGQFIRRTSIDELPQFINVLKGDMSIVGPRPHAVQHNELYQQSIEDYMQRYRVKPGITGWAQIHGLRGETDTVDKMIKRVQFDMQYIRDWNLWLDIKIIIWTAFKGWTGNNAY
jgi:putative colanic acid biosynthesis UDP-glucose lipid carrier transferase